MHAQRQVDERLNIRPLILAACFLWGLLCGFLAYILRTGDTPPEPPPPESVTVQAPAPPKETPPESNPRIQAAARTPAPEQRKPSAPRTPDMPAVEEDVPAEAADRIETVTIHSGPPEPAPYTIHTDWGLTGATARKPRFVETRPLRPAPAPAEPPSALPPPAPELDEFR